jgi:maltose O-acetyltransferase
MSSISNILREARAASHLRFTIVNGLLRCLPPFASGYIRGRMYRWIGMDVDSTAFLMANLDIVGGSAGHLKNLKVGRGVTIATHVMINCDALVTLGENVNVGPFVRLYTTSHDIGPGSQRALPSVVAKPIVIEKGSWLAVGATVLPGVTIGHGSIVAAGAVVDKDVPPDSYVSGVPAQLIRKLPLGNR